MKRISLQEKTEGMLLILFLVVNMALYFLCHKGFIMEFSALVLMVLLFVWIKNAKCTIERNHRRRYNTFMLVLGIYGKSVCLLSFAFWLSGMPFYKEMVMIAKVSMLLYIVVSLINKEYRNALWGLVYKII